MSFCCFILFSSLSSPRFRSILIIKTFGKKRKNRFAFLQKIIISYLKLGQKIVFFWVKKSSFANKNVSLILFQMFATSIQTFVNLLKNNFKLTILNYFKRFKEYFIKEMFLLLFLHVSFPHYIQFNLILNYYRLPHFLSLFEKVKFEH